ncbi:MAG TPA: hypothetical protein VN541_21105 [Tepidisphaeraceae bacterium]|nr:hypothetical protein [Tepidisphaeraceae bacterium]
MPSKPWTTMTASELAKATRQYDDGHRPRAVAPPARQKAKHERAMRPGPKRGPGRPRLGAGAARVLFSIDPDLLTRLDDYARRHGMKRSHLIAASVKAYMAHTDRKTNRRIAG